MPITPVWYDDQRTAILNMYQGQWDWDAYYQNIEQLRVMLAGTSQEVILIIDIRHSASIPQGAMSHFSRGFNRLGRSQIGQVILVGANRFVESLYHVLQKLYPGRDSKFVIAANMAEVERVVAARRSGQPT
jgi:hypothetical protein